jgi:hypothetical protein
LLRGQEAERKWVDECRSQGRSVAHGRKIVVSKHDIKTDHVNTPDAVALMSIEIKERSMTFTGPEDWPYDTVFVDDLRGMKFEVVRNFAYVFLSKPTGKWAWLTPLDRDDTWSEGETFDRGRGHKVPVLIAPKRFLRPSHTLVQYIYPHHLLELVDGDTAAFLSGGGETEERERYTAGQDGGLGERVTKAPRKAR